MKVWRSLQSVLEPRKLVFGFGVSLFFTLVSSQAATAHDVLGPSSRTTPIAISEIMYKPAPRTDGKNVEFLEIYNSNPWFQDISGYQVTCADMNYTFPVGTLINSNSFIVLAAAPADIESVYGVTNVMGPYTGSLKKSETLQLLDERTNVLLTVPYSDVFPWPVAADGAGHSIILANPTYGEGDPRAWDISDVIGGSPGQPDVFTPGPLRNVQAVGTDLLLNWLGNAGQIYQLEVKTNLTDAVWTPVGNFVTGTGAILTLTNNFGNSPQRFFRLQLVN